MSLPNNIVNGQAIDAVPVMANFNSLDGRMPPSNAIAAKSGANSDITSLTGLTTPLAVSEGGTGDSGTAWTTASITLAAQSGTLTTASATMRYKKIGKTVFYNINVSITTNGTGAGYLIVGGFPWTAAVSAAIAGYNGAGVSLVGAHSGTSANLFKYDGTYPGANGASLVFTGVAETT